MSFCGVIDDMSIFLPKGVIPARSGGLMSAFLQIRRSTICHNGNMQNSRYNSVFSQLLKSFCSVFSTPTKIQKNSIFHSGLFMPEICTPGGYHFQTPEPGILKKCFLRSIRLPDPAQRVWRGLGIVCRCNRRVGMSKDFLYDSNIDTLIFQIHS